MKKTVLVLHTAYIAVISGMLAISALQGNYRQFFSSTRSYAVHTSVGIALVLCCIVVVVAHFRWPQRVSTFQVLWWLPQILIVVTTTFASPDRTVYVLHSLWHWPMGPSFAPQLGWELEPDNYLWVRFNLVALLGITLATLTKKREPNSTVEGSA